MILPATKEMELTDDQFEELMLGFDNALDQYIKTMLEDYLAFYLSKSYELSALFENKLDVIAYTAISLLEGSRSALYDLNIVKEKLEKNYRLKITDDSRTTMEEL